LPPLTDPGLKKKEGNWEDITEKSSGIENKHPAKQAGSRKILIQMKGKVSRGRGVLGGQQLER